MAWAKHKLEIVDMYGRKTIGFTDAYRRFAAKIAAQGGKRVVDLCCGYGQHSLDLAENGFHVTALDSDQTKLDHLRNACRQQHARIDLVNADMKNTSLQSASCDAVLCLSAIHHQTYRDIVQTIGEIHRLLVPGGLLLFDILSAEDRTFGIGTRIEGNTFVGSRPGEEDVPHHYATQKEIADLLRSYSGYHVEAIEYELQYGSGILDTRLYDVFAIK